MVEQVELDGVACARVLDSKVEPLDVTLRIDVVLHETVVFLVGNLLRKEQISALKS
jgi:hypothetical protein